jgi:hypothetical protein
MPLQEAQFTTELERFYNEPNSCLRSDSSFVCLALAVFALGSQWTTLAKPEDLDSACSPENSDPGRIFYNQARVIIGDIMDSASLQSVQAAFVLGVYLMPASAIGASYIYMGLAMRKALALGLHQNILDPTMSEREREIRRRLWWAIYSLERYITSSLGRTGEILLTVLTEL